jgi:hypothetical protein
MKKWWGIRHVRCLLLAIWYGLWYEYDEEGMFPCPATSIYLDDIWEGKA